MDDEEVEIGAVPEAAADPIALPTNAEDEEGGVPMWLVVLMSAMALFLACTLAFVMRISADFKPPSFEEMHNKHVRSEREKKAAAAREEQAAAATKRREERREKLRRRRYGDESTASMRHAARLLKGRPAGDLTTDEMRQIISDAQLEVPGHLERRELRVLLERAAELASDLPERPEHPNDGGEDDDAGDADDADGGDDGGRTRFPELKGMTPAIYSQLERMLGEGASDAEIDERFHELVQADLTHVFQRMTDDERERVRGLIARSAPEAEIDRAFLGIKAAVKRRETLKSLPKSVQRRREMEHARGGARRRSASSPTRGGAPVPGGGGAGGAPAATPARRRRRRRRPAARRRGRRRAEAQRYG